MKVSKKLSSMAILLFSFVYPPFLAEAKVNPPSNASHERQNIKVDTNLVRDITRDLYFAQLPPYDPQAETSTVRTPADPTSGNNSGWSNWGQPGMHAIPVYPTSGNNSGWSNWGQPGTQQPRWGQPGMQQPRWGQSGTQQPRWGQPGMQQPRWGQPGMQQRR